MYKDNKNGKIGIIVTVIVLICLVIITNLDNNILSKIVNPFTKITMSAQSGVAYLKNKLSKNNEYFVTQDELKSQNKTLKEYVKLTDQYSEYNTTPGYVIQRDFSNYSKVVVINIGKNDGIESGMTVVAEGGLVGYVVSVEDNSSKVQTIIDTASAVSAAFVNTEKSLVTRGILDSKDRVKGTYIDNDVVVNEGDSIVTSGIGGIYPKNINIGKVKEIVNTQNKTNRYVYIETAVDFDNLNNVLVIKK